MLTALTRRLLYHPQREMVATPQQAGLGYRQLTLTAEDGVRVVAWYVPAERADAPAILYCHGNAGNISTRLPTLLLCHQLGFGVLAFDYRGYGFSEGTPSEEGTARDARAAWDALTGPLGIGPGRVVLVGRSLGGAIAARLANERPAAGVSLECAFTSVPDVAAELFWFLPARWIVRAQYPTVAHVRRFDCPVMVAHSPDDRLIRYHHGEELYAAAQESKRFVRLRGSHAGAVHESGEVYRQALADFVNACTGR